MNGATLKTIRESLGLSVSWLAAAANVEERTVRYWEARLDGVPDDVRLVIEQLERLAAETAERGLAVIREQITANRSSAKPVLLLRYGNDDDLGRYQPDMAGLPATFHASILAKIRGALKKDDVEVVIRWFDASAYEAWRRTTHQTDSAALRAQFIGME
ncbi:MAG: DUF1870 family protein [Azonexus sp.]|jgi:transcriptional regulator with XRE-family HTH domain|nr:DUF1870 family protein [Azonexus sp.]